jgi:hypothetical protein
MTIMIRCKLAAIGVECVKAETNPIYIFILFFTGGVDTSDYTSQGEAK